MRLTMDRRRFAALAGTAAASGAILGLAACSNPDAQSDKTAFSDTGDGAIPEKRKVGELVLPGLYFMVLCSRLRGRRPGGEGFRQSKFSLK